MFKIFVFFGLLFFSAYLFYNRYSCLIKDDYTRNTRNRIFYDATASLGGNTIVYPGDPVFNSKTIFEVGNNSEFGLSKIEFSNHAGTHIDFPSHVIRNGKSSSDYDISHLIGPGVIIKVPNNANSIGIKHVNNIDIPKDSIVFFKTRNSELLKNGPTKNDYVYIEDDLAQLLIDKEVRIVGIDYLSVDNPKNESLSVHKKLLSNDILIVENLSLSKIEEGNCVIYISPLKVENMDGLPSRVLIEK